MLGNILIHLLLFIIDFIFIFAIFRYKRPFDKGNLYIKFDIIFPPLNWTSPENLTLLESILPPRQPLPLMKEDMAEDVVLSNVDPMQERRSQAHHAHDEDEEGHQPGVQCAQA